MTNINFTSTYRIPITQAGATPAKKDKLRDLVEPYPNKLVSKCNTGTVRVSMADKEDAKFIRNLKAIGYTVFQKFEGENIRKGKLDDYIKNKLALGEYQQFGTQKKRLSTSAKSKRHAAKAELGNIRESRKIDDKVKEALSETLDYINVAIIERDELKLRLEQAEKKAEAAQKAKVLAEIIEETKKARSVIETASKRRTILKQAAKRTEEARNLAEIAEQERAECARLYNQAVEKVEDAQFAAEIKGQVMKERLSIPKTETEEFDPFDADFNFDDFEIL